MLRTFNKGVGICEGVTLQASGLGFGVWPTPEGSMECRVFGN